MSDRGGGVVLISPFHEEEHTPETTRDPAYSRPGQIVRSVSEVTEEEIPVSVVDRRTSADGVVSVTLAAAGGTPLPAWAPGSHIDLLLDKDLVRQYSLVPADEGRWGVAVLRDPRSRGGSEYVHEKLQMGVELMVRGPRNHFELLDAEEYLFVGGGIGITPLIAMVEQAESEGVDWRLVYGGRTRGSMAYADSLVAKYGERVSLVPEDELGLIDLRNLLSTPKPGTLVYCCGPTPLLDAVDAVCAAQSWEKGSLHMERFSPIEAGEPVWDGSFEIELVESELVLTVPPDKSILQIVDAAGIDVLSSCGEGTCGTCETTIVSGEADHRDSVLTDEEKAANNSMMICVSRAACPRLRLEL